jgi:histidinol-phosphate aminotransferase
MRIQGYPDPGTGVRLHLNENTGGCSPRVLDAIRRLSTTDVSTYPSYTDLVLACARHFDVDPEWVLLTNGLDEGILMAAVGHISRPRVQDAETIIPLPAFDPYPNSTAAVGATAVRIPPGPGYAFPTDQVLAAISPRTRLIFLNTPNNPTGQLIPIDDLKRVAGAAPDAVLIVDEAYIEFGGTTFIPELSQYPNVLVGRTFSKAYGLAGMRVGILIGQPQSLDPVRAVTLPFNINAVAIAATLAALEDREFLPRYAAQVAESRQRLYAACRRLGLD